MAQAKPTLRSDLIISRQAAAGGTSFVIKDPATGQFFRFRDAEHFVARQLDGSTPLDVIRQRAEGKFGATLAPDALAQFIKTLGRHGLLETDGAESGHLTGPRGRVRGSLLLLRLKAFDPDRLFNRLIGKVRFFFTRPFLVASAALIAVAFGTTFLHWHEIGQDVLRLYRVETFILAWFVILLVGITHEFAHGLTCKHFGGEVHELGFMLLYFQPALYCNVSDAWLFPEKSKRLWVTFAGAYFELFVWALATLTWRLTNPEAWPNLVALVVMATSGIKTFFNFNPLVRLDGYYLLSDYLEIPNLRRRAFRYIGTGIKRLVSSAVHESTDATPRERRLFLVYGLVATVFSFVLLGFVVVKLSNFLLPYQTAGLLLFTFLFVPRLRRRLGRLGFQPPIPFRREKSRRAPIKRPATMVALLAGLLAVLFLVPMELKATGEFKVLPSRNADVRAEVTGIIEKISVDEWRAVRAGDLIARLFDRDYSADLRQTEGQIAEKTARLRMLKAGPRPEEIEVARREVQTAKATVDAARKEYEQATQILAHQRAKAEVAVKKAEEQLQYNRIEFARFKALLKGDFISRKDYAAAENLVVLGESDLHDAQAALRMVLADDLAPLRKALVVAETQRLEAEGKLALLVAGTRQEEIDAAEAEIARLRAQRDYQAEQLRLVNVVTPIAGVITTPTRQLRGMIGQQVNKGDLIAEVHELNTITAEIAIPEKEIGDVHVGQTVFVKARAYPEQTFAGTVTSIATAVTGNSRAPTVSGASTATTPQSTTEGERTVLVTTRLDNTSHFLKPEMTGKAKIYCGGRSIFDLITRRLARTVRVEFWSWW